MRSSASVLCLSIVILSACVPTRYEVRFDGLAPNGRQAIAADARLAVVPNPQSEDPLLGAEVERKIAADLRARGFTITTPDSADVLLMAGFGIGSPREVGSVESVWIPGSTATVSTPSSGTVGTVSTSGRMGLVPTTETVYDRWLTLVAVDAHTLQGRTTPVILWRGQTKSTGSSGDLRMVLNYLLVPTLGNLGLNTTSQRVYNIRASDPRAVKLSQQ